MLYELRKWSDDDDCLYTDDQRVKDLAISSPEMRIVARYFRTAKERHPFAWDIVAPRPVISRVARQYGKQAAGKAS